MSTPTYRILVTNDDGVESLGLSILASHLAAVGHDVFVAAPALEASGSGAAVGGVMTGDVVHTRVVTLAGAPGIRAFAVDGPPGRCVLAAALGAFGPPPELVVSGINPGANVGRFLQLHSGTLGAALTAAGFGISAMAVSIEHIPPTHWVTAAIVATRLVPHLAECERPTVLNLNVPDRPVDDVRGLRTAPVRPVGPSRLVLEGSAPGTLLIGMVEREPRPGRPADDSDTDASLLEAGYAVITRVRAPAGEEPSPFPTGVF